MYEICAEEAEGNFVVSPLSIYMALAILYAVGDEAVKADIRALFGMTAGDIAKTGQLFEALVRTRSVFGEPTTILDMTNSIWLTEGLEPNPEVLDKLAEALFCYAFEAPFATDNEGANEAVRAFIREKTRGLIDQNFDLDPDTVFALINTLYFKDAWSAPQGLPTEQRSFETADGAEKPATFLVGSYQRGVVGETECSEFFYETTYGGYRVKLILPKEGYTLADAMSAKNLAAVNAYGDYADETVKETHKTRCIFPAFEAEGELTLEELLAAAGYLASAFSGYTTDLIDGEFFVSKITHKAVLRVDEEGVEGAAVTIIENKATAVFEDKVVFHDFVLDRPFGYLVTTYDGVVLFAGQTTDV